jgi:hypothetical protein
MTLLQPQLYSRSKQLQLYLLYSRSKQQLYLLYSRSKQL